MNHRENEIKVSDKSLTDRKSYNIDKLTIRHSCEYKRLKSIIATNDNEIKDSKANLFNFDPETFKIIDIINKKYRDRSQRDNLDLYNYLLKANIQTELKSDLIQSDLSMEGLYFFISQFISISNYKKNDVIYNIDEKCENIYLILYGEVKLLEVETFKDNLTGEEYFMYLNSEYKNNNIDTFLLMTIIEANKEIYPVYSINDVNNFNIIIFIVKLAILADNNDIEQIKQLYLNENEKFELFQFDQVTKGDLSIERYLNNITQKFNECHYFYLSLLKNEILSSDKQKNEISKKKYKQFSTKKKFDFFGNFKLGNLKSLREETAQCTEDSWFLQINKKMYSTMIFNEKRMMREKELDLLHHSYFFKALHKSAFNKKIFMDLDSEEHNKNTALYSQNDELTKFYIVKQGIVEISLSNTNLLELKQIISKLKKMIPKSKLEELTIKENYSLNHPYEIVQKSLETKRKFSIFLSEKSLYGEIEYYYNMPSFFNATVNSDKVQLYTFPFSKYKIINNESYALAESLKETSQNKIKTILERLISINNSYYSKINEEYTRKIIEEEELIHGHKINFSKKDLNVKVNHKNNALSNIKNKESYISYDSDLYEELSKKLKGRENMKFHGHSESKAPAGTLVTEMPLTRNKKHISIIKRPQISILLPSIQPPFSYKRNKSPLLDNRIKQPLSTVQNVPLINKLKRSINYHHLYNNQQIIDFRIISLKQRKQMDINTIINAYPGGYYLAVQHFLAVNRNKRNKQK